MWRVAAIAVLAAGCATGPSPAEQAEAAERDRQVAWQRYYQEQAEAQERADDAEAVRVCAGATPSQPDWWATCQRLEEGRRRRDERRDAEREREMQAHTRELDQQHEALMRRQHEREMDALRAEINTIRMQQMWQK